MTLTPHGFTVLVEPDTPPARSDSGLIVMPEDSEYIATSGTVVAVGKGSQRLWEARQKAYQRAMAAVLRGCSHGCDCLAEMERVVTRTEPSPSVCVGDRVVFGPEAGLIVTDEGKSYLLLEEDRIAIIVDEDAERFEAVMRAAHEATRHVGDGFGNSFESKKAV